MAEIEKCAECGGALVAAESGLSCPKCLLAAGLMDSDPGSGAVSADAPSPEDLSAHFPNLEILELIGQGGMGIVYKARQVSLDRIVALKILPSGIAIGPSFADRFAREARTMARLDHANIVRVYEFGEADGLYYLVMEFVDGLNLRQLMEAGGVEPREALSIIPQICDALQFAHDRGIVHRDVKPENVLLDRDGLVKITDFGLAKLLDHRTGEHRITGTGQVMGTVHYMAPEQYRTPDDVDHRADIFSLGVVFYELLTGELPIGRFAPPSANVQVDVRLDEVVLRALEQEPEQRYQRVAQVKTEVDSILSQPAAAAAAPPRVPARGPAGSRLSMLALFGFLCAPAALALPIIGGIYGGLTGKSTAIIIFFAPAALLLPIGFILSLAGWISIARSKGALRGLPLAVIGTFAPGLLFLLAIGMSMFYLTIREPMQEPEPVPVQMGGLSVDPIDGFHDQLRQDLDRFGELWNTLCPLDCRGDVPQADPEKLYAELDLKRLELLDSDTRDLLGKEGVLGLPLLHNASDDLYLDMYGDLNLSRPAFQGGVMVDASYGTRRLVFDLVREGDQFKFALSPVRHEATQSVLTEVGARGAARVFLGIWRNLLTREGLPRRSQIPAAVLPVLFAPSRLPALADRGAPGLCINGTSGSFGLLFMAPPSVPGSPADYKVSAVSMGENGLTARVKAEDDNKGFIEFSMMFEDGRWWLTPGKVE